MKWLTKQLLVSLAMVLGLANAAHANGGDDCDARTLHGLYLFSASGFNISATGASIPKVIAEFIRFNGDGTLSVPGGTVIVGGVKLPPFPAGGINTYSVAQNCIGTLTFTAELTFDIFVSPARGRACHGSNRPARFSGASRHAGIRRPCIPLGSPTTSSA